MWWRVTAPAVAYAVTWVHILSPILAAGAVWCVVSAATEPEDEEEDEEP
jgi:pheromone shutdown protein TraB